MSAGAGAPPVVADAGAARRTTRLALVAGMASLLDSAAIVSVGSALPLWRSHLGLDDWSVGLVSSSMTLSIAAGALLGGRLADRLGRRRVFSATVGLYAVGAAWVAAAQTLEQLVAGVVVLGAASGADLPASIALVAERTPAEVRGRMVALTHVLWTVGIVTATAMAVVASPAGLAGARAAFVVLALGALGTLVARRRAVLAAPRSERLDSGPAPPAAGGRSGLSRRLLLIAAFYVVYTLVANTFGSFRTYFLVVEGGATQTGATVISFAVTLLGLAGTVVFSAIADTRWRRRVYPAAGALLVGAQVLVAASGAGSLGLVVAALVAYSLAYPYAGEGLYKVWAQESVRPDLRATFQGATIAAARAAAALFALVTPSLMSWSPAGLFWVLAACAATAMAIGALVQRR
ncbi:MFS transporter [Nocardioides sp. TF02-7]|uniref:MFS transporter n=1 Tax=Nocardioides sp. TF02-7 TaxID=2917724 RepID=UPI001F07012D|nr:MFS transporter [Nocardioides sp. TF02-7]UMG93985.1 MFS transporter [Nocardioides sp. TF02-7]